MLNARLKAGYLRLRRKWWRAADAYRQTIVGEEFDCAEHDGHVRIRREPEIESATEFAPDFGGDKRDEKAWWDNVRHYGIDYYVAEYRSSEDGRWHVVDSIGGVEGWVDLEDTGYQADLQDAALRAWELDQPRTVTIWQEGGGL